MRATLSSPRAAQGRTRMVARERTIQGIPLWLMVMPGALLHRLTFQQGKVFLPSDDDAYKYNNFRRRLKRERPCPTSSRRRRVSSTLVLKVVIRQASSGQSEMKINFWRRRFR